MGKSSGEAVTVPMDVLMICEPSSASRMLREVCSVRSKGLTTKQTVSSPMRALIRRPTARA